MNSIRGRFLSGRNSLGLHGILIALVLLALTGSSWAADDNMMPLSRQTSPQISPTYLPVAELPSAHMPGQMESVPMAMHGQAGAWIGSRLDPSRLDDPVQFFVDDSYTGAESGYGVTLFNSIQAAIDASSPGDFINVYPGTYSETASGRQILGAGATYQFGLFIDINHSGITVRGVDAGGNPITSYSGILADVTTNGTANFGPDGVWVEGDGVTISGLKLQQCGSCDMNKLLEVIGDNFTIKYCNLFDGSSLYFDDWRYNTTTDESWIRSYHVEGNFFANGTSIDPNSGAGKTGPVSGRQILNNTFDLAGADWNAISFSGSGTGVPWFIYSVGGAVITGNNFYGGATQYIRARGDYDNSQFDWQSYFTGNTFDKSVAAVNGGNWANSLTEFSYTSGSYTMNHVRRIGTSIQAEIVNAQNGDEILVGPGTYFEHDIDVNKSLTITGNPGDAQPGPGANAPVVDGQSNWMYGFSLANGVSNVTIQGFEIRNYVGTLTGDGDAILAWVASTSHITVADNYMHNVDWNGVLVGNDGATGDHTYWTIARNILTDFGKSGTPDNSGYGLELTNTSFGVIEDNVIDGGSRFPGIGILVTMRRLAGQDIVIQRNSVRGQYDNAGIYVGGFGNEVPNNNLDNVRILNNDVQISGATNRALNVRDYESGTVTNVVIDHNTLIKTGGFGIQNLTALRLNAEQNYWGSIAMNVIAPKIDGDVDWSPWCNSDFSICTYAMPVHNVTQALDYMTIQAAVTAANAGDVIEVDAGTYTENVNVTQRVSIIGAGSGSDPATSTIITQTPAGSGDSRIGVIQLTASGISAANPILLQDIRLLPSGMAGISVGRFTEATGQTVQYVKLDNVHVIGTNVSPSTEQERGLYVDNSSSLRYLEVVDCAFNNLTYGWYIQKVVSADASNVQYVSVGNTTFNHNNHKGFYAEKLSDATFTGCTFDGNGYYSAALPDYFRAWSCGFDVNLKAGTYANITVDGCVITNNAIDQSKEGAGLTIKARDDGATYGAYPAALNNVDVINCTISGNERGLRFGEPTKNNATPTNVTVYHNTFCNNVQHYSGIDGTAYGALINMTTAAVNAEQNYWCSVDQPAVAGVIANSSTGSVDYTPWCNSDFTMCNFGLRVHNITQSTHYETIQAAIDAANPNDEIHADAGLYSERVVINKALTLLGATAAVNKNGYTVPANYSWNTAVESVIDYPDPTGRSVDEVCVDIFASNVTFKGFVVEIRNARASSDHLLRVNAAIAGGAGTYIDNVVVDNNVLGPVTNVVAQDGNQGRMGLYLSAPTYPSQRQGIRNSHFGGNKIFDARGNGDAVFVWGSAAAYNSLQNADFTGTVIEGNEIYGSHRSGVEVSGGTSGLTIRNNKIFGNSSTINGGSPDANLKYGNGVVFIRIGGDRGLATAMGSINLTMTGNDIYSNEKNGIYYGPINSNHTITGNVIRDNGWDGVRVDLDEAYYPSGCYVEHGRTADIALRLNSISGNGGIGVQLTGVPTNGFILDASGCWWGMGSPSTAGLVDYTPYCGTDGSYTNPGFTPDLSNLWVTPLGSQYGTVGRIQEAANLVSGSTINLIAGTYVGQVMINAFPTALDIVGMGATPADVVIKAAPSMAPIPATTRRPVVAIVNSSTVNLSNLTVDGDNQGSTNNSFIGVAYWNAGGTMTNCNVLRVEDATFSGAQHGVGVYGNNNDVGAFTITLNTVLVDDFQKTAMAFSGVGLSVDLDNCSTIGAGDTPVTAQNGIQIGYGATATVDHCTISGMSYIGSSWTASGILLYASGNVAIGNSTALNGCQSAVYALNSSGSFINSSITGNANSDLGVLAYNYTSGLLAHRDREIQPLAESNTGYLNHRSLDANASFNVSGSTIVGGLKTNSIGVEGYAAGDILSMNVTNCSVSNWDIGLGMVADGGTFTSAAFTGNVLGNTTNAYDNVVGHTWDANCYSDFAVNSGYPTQYNIDNAGNVDLHPNANSCTNVDLTIVDPYVGCPAGCNNTDVVNIGIDQAGLTNLELVIQLPAGFALNCANGTDIRPPAGVRDPHVTAAWVNAVGTTVNIAFTWEPPYSSGVSTQLIAAIPVINTGATTGTFGFAGLSSNWADDQGNMHPNTFLLGTVSVNVDCQLPVITSFTNSATCAFGAADQMVNMFTTVLDRGAAPGDAPLESAWIMIGANRYDLTALNPAVNPNTITFPATAGDAAILYGWLANNACTTITLHVKDVKCNETTADVIVGRDEADPNLTVTPVYPASVGCVNDNPASPQYGPTVLDNLLHISSDLGTNDCRDGSGTLTIAYGANVYGTILALPVIDYPDVTAAGALWTWMKSVLVGADGATYTFDVTANDCAGNSVMLQFNICVDVTDPENTVDFFDARPADAGVWLAWQWTANSQAVAMEIWRSPLSGEYPQYPGDLWNSLSNYSDAVYPPVGWTKVTTQTGSGIVTSAAQAAVNNNRGDVYSHVDGSWTYWLDAEAGWSNANAASTFRDIYRYITFVKDAGGNWSVNKPVNGHWDHLTAGNADRSTNYWLGDFTPADAGGLSGSAGFVDTEDLDVLAASYFKQVGAGAAAYCNIGPVLTENGNVGKGIPNPDVNGFVNFYDLVPFSFNYNMVSPVGGAKEFLIMPDPNTMRAFAALDETPSVSICRTTDQPIVVGEPFTVTVSLSGNESGAVKAVEAILSYNADLLEFVSATTPAVELNQGSLFSKTNPVEGRTGEIGMVAAGLGNGAMIVNNAILSTLTFRWIAERAGNADLSLVAVRLADGNGGTLDGTGNILSIGAEGIIPQEYSLHQNFPNPFNPQTEIAFDLKAGGYVTLNVFNVLGQRVATLVNTTMEAGKHRVTFDAANLSSGLYVYQIQVNGFTAHRKMLLMR